MSRRGAPLKRGPDLSWDDGPDEEPATKHDDNVPGPTYPPRHIRVPKPLTADEKDAAQAFLDYRARCRRGPLYCTLDKSMVLEEGETRRRRDDARRGFDAFAGQTRWNGETAKKSRKTPDIRARREHGVTLRLYPEELWGILDPERTMEGWAELRESSLAWASAGVKRVGVKRKRPRRVQVGAEDEEQDEGETSGEDEVVGAAERKRRAKAARSRRADAANGASVQKRGLDAEDEDDEREPVEGEDDEGGDDEEPVDSEFEESDDGQGDDYNAEQYFDAGDDDDFGAGDGGGGGDDDGGAF